MMDYLIGPTIGLYLSGIPISYNPEGGLGDLRGTFSTIEEARNAAAGWPSPYGFDYAIQIATIDEHGNLVEVK